VVPSTGESILTAGAVLSMLIVTGALDPVRFVLSV
jgi:hypothetical protein